MTREALLERARAGFVDVGDRAGEADVLQVTGTVAAQRGDTTLGARTLSREPCDPRRARRRVGCRGADEQPRDRRPAAGRRLGGPRATPTARSPSTRSWATAGGSGPARSTSPGWTGWRATTKSARRRCEEAIRLATEVGDRLNAGIAQNNLGDALRDLDRLDEAGRAYAAAVITYRDVNDLGPLMALLEDVAILAARRGDQDVAFTLVGASDALRRALGAPRSGGAEAGLVDQLEPARAALGGDAADAARQRGSRTSRRRGDRPRHRGCAGRLIPVSVPVRTAFAPGCRGVACVTPGACASFLARAHGS